MSVFHSLSSSFPVPKADELLKKVVCPQSLPPYVLFVTQYPAETIPTWITNAIKKQLCDIKLNAHIESAVGFDKFCHMYI